MHHTILPSKTFVYVTVAALAMCAVVVSDEHGATSQDDSEIRKDVPASQRVESVVVSDHFATDSRSQYTTTGVIGWQEGLLEIGPDVRVSRRLPPSPIVDLSLELRLPQSVSPDGVTQLEIGLALETGETIAVIIALDCGKAEPTAELRFIQCRKPDTTAADNGEQAAGPGGDTSGIRSERVAPDSNTMPANEFAASRSKRLTPVANGTSFIDTARYLLIWASNSIPPRSSNWRVTRSWSAMWQQVFGRCLCRKSRQRRHRFPRIGRPAGTVGGARDLGQQALKFDEEGNYRAAIPVAENSLQARREVLGEEHLEYATSLNFLAGLHFSQGQFDQAERLYKQNLDLLRRLTGVHHPAYSSCLNDLGLLYHLQGAYAKAEPYYRQDLEITRHVMGEQHLDYATSLNNSAGLYEKMGEYAQAEALHREARKSSGSC